MFEVSHLSVAVDNVHPDVKSRADIIIGHHNDEAVLDFIEEDIKNTTLG